MLLFTKEIKNKLINNHNQQDGTKEFKAVCKLFNPSGTGTWYLSELNKEDNVAFGLVHIHNKELGYIDIDELQNFRGVFGLKIERDKNFPINQYSLEECKQL
jgi:hypothetical protein